MKIGMDCRLLQKPITGMGRYTINLLREFSTNKSDRLFTFGHIQDRSFEHDTNIVEVDIPCTNPREYLKFESLSAYLHDMDLIFSPFEPIPERRSCRGVLTIHDVIPLIAPEWCWSQNVVRFFEEDIRRCVKHVNHVITVSNSAKRDILSHYNLPEERVTAIPLAPDPVFYLEPSDDFDQLVLDKYGIATPYILSVCTLEPRKNLERVLLAYETFRERYKHKISLVLVGQTGWNIETLLRRIGESRYKDDITVTGYVRNEELPSLYRKSELFVYPSLYEGFGLPIIEAMAAGAPVLTSNTSSMPEVGGDVAIYCDPYDVESIRAGMDQILLTREQDRLLLVEKGIERAKQFNWSITAELTRAVFERVVHQ